MLNNSKALNNSQTIMATVWPNSRLSCKMRVTLLIPFAHLNFCKSSSFAQKICNHHEKWVLQYHILWGYGLH